MSSVLCRRRLFAKKKRKTIDAKPDFLFFKNSVFRVLIAASDAARREDAGSRLENAVRVLKVGFVNDLLLRKNFGPNVVFETLDL